MYHNFIFDLYGTLVDIHTNENKTSLWKRLALFYSFQGASYTGRELRNRYRQLETAARKVPSSYTCPEICAADIFRTLYVEKGIQPTEALLTATGQFFRIPQYFTMLSRHDWHTAAAPCKRLWDLPPVQCPADLHRIRAALAGTLGSVRRYPYLL